MANVKPEDITPEMVEAVENAVGMGSGAWDCVDPRKIIAASRAAIAKAPSDADGLAKERAMDFEEREFIRTQT